MILGVERDDAEASSDPSWVEDLFGAHYSEMVGVATILLGDRDAAEDVVQDAFVALARRPVPLEDPTTAVGYLRRSVVNGCRSRQRRKGVEARHRPVPEPAAASAQEVAEDRSSAGELAAALDLLPGQQRVVVVLRFYGELTPPEISQVLEISVNSVKTHLRRAMKRLSRALEVKS